MENETILIVDDNKEIVYSISELLKFEGYQVEKAYDGMEALDALEQKKIDLILVKSVSRFARNMADCLSVVWELRELGVTVIFEKENISTTAPNFDALTSLMAEFTRAECEHLTKNSVHTHYMAPISRPAKKTWKKTIRLPGRPKKTITFRME